MFRSFFFISLLAINSSAQAQVITEVVGKTAEGEKCSFTFAEMSEWEGQLAVFLNGPEGNFRIEINPDQVPLKEGPIQGSQKGIKVRYDGKTLSSFSREWDGIFVAETTSIEIIVDQKLKTPKYGRAESIIGRQTSEFVECWF